MAQLTPVGLVIKRFNDIVADIKAYIQQNATAQLSLEDTTILGQMNNAYATQQAIMEEALQSVYNSMDRDKAEGTALDDLLYQIGLERLAASRSAGFVSFTLRDTVTIPARTIVSNPSTNDRFRTTQSVSADTTNCKAVYYSIEVGDERTYQITIDGTPYSYTSDTDATLTEILNGLIDVIQDGGSTRYTVSIEPINGVDHLKILAIGENTVDTAIIQYMKAERVRVIAPIEALEFGPIQAPAGAISKMVTAVGGVFTVVNETPIGVGRLRETDAQFRQRASRTLALGGSATFNAMLTAVVSIAGNNEVVLLQNTTMSTDANGLPPKSFEVIINLPDTVENRNLVGNTIFGEQPLGIEAHGDISVTVYDIAGNPHVVKFSLPSDVYIAVRVSYEIYDEEVLPDHYQDLIKEGVIEYGTNLSSGKDVIPSRFFGSIYSAVPDGLGNIVVECQVLVDPDDVPDPLEWSTSTISISPKQTPAFLLQNVFVEEL